MAVNVTRKNTAVVNFVGRAWKKAVEGTGASNWQNERMKEGSVKLETDLSHGSKDAARMVSKDRA